MVSIIFMLLSVGLFSIVNADVGLTFVSKKEDFSGDGGHQYYGRALSNDGQYVFVQHNGRHIEIYNANDFTIYKNLTFTGSSTTDDVAIVLPIPAYQNRIIATKGQPYDIRYVDWTDNTTYQTLNIGSSENSLYVVNYDATRFASVSQDGGMNVYNLENGNLVYTEDLSPSGSYAGSCAFNQYESNIDFITTYKIDNEYAHYLHKVDGNSFTNTSVNFTQELFNYTGIKFYAPFVKHEFFRWLNNGLHLVVYNEDTPHEYYYVIVDSDDLSIDYAINISSISSTSESITVTSDGNYILFTSSSGNSRMYQINFDSETLTLLAQTQPTMEYVVTSYDATRTMFIDTTQGYENPDLYVYDTDISAYEGGSYEGSGYGDLSDYEQICEGGKGSYMNLPSNNRYVENRYDVPVSVTIKAVDLFIDNGQYTYCSSTKNDYKLYVNGKDCSRPDYLFSDGTGYTLRWTGINKDLTDEKPVFEFKCDGKDWLDRYWYGLGVNMEGGAFKYHNNNAIFGDGEYNGGSGYSFGLGMCFYYDSRVESDLEYDDTIHAVPTGKTQFYEYDTITFQYTVGEYYNTYLQLWHDSNSDGNYDSQYTGGEFGNGGYNINTFVGTTSFIPKQTHDGDWQINIIRSGVNVTSFNFSVSNLSHDTDYNGQIWTSPKNTQVNQDFNIGWLYNKTYYDNYDGIILYTKEQNLKGETWIIKDGIKTNNEIGMSYSIPFQGIYYIWLCVNEGNDNYIAIDQTVQYVGMNTYNNYITTDKDHYELEFTERSSIAQAYVTIGYSHMFLGGDVYIVFGNSSMSPYFIGNSPQGELEVNYVNAGLYSVKLVYYTSSNEYEVLDEKTFTVGDTNFQEDDKEVQGDDLATLLDENFDEDFQFFIGIIIIGFLVFLPLYASFVWGTGLNTFQGMFKTQKEIDGIVYTMLGIIGLAIDIYLELFELWTLVLFVFAFTMIVAWQVSNKIGGNGE